jgi:hypothetical protein
MIRDFLIYVAAFIVADHIVWVLKRMYWLYTELKKGKV